MKIVTTDKIIIIILTWILLLLIGACSKTILEPVNSSPSQTLESELIHNTLLCGADITQPSVLWISDEATLQQRYDLFEENSDTNDSPPAIDFTSRGILLIAMGPRPTSGFLLNPLPQQNSRFDGSILEVPVSWREPDSGSTQAQVLTSPCMLLAIPQIKFSRVRIIDQNGVLRVATGRATARASGS